MIGPDALGMPIRASTYSASLWIGMFQMLSAAKGQEIGSRLAGKAVACGAQAASVLEAQSRTARIQIFLIPLSCFMGFALAGGREVNRGAEGAARRAGRGLDYKVGAVGAGPDEVAAPSGAIAIRGSKAFWPAAGVSVAGSTYGPCGAAGAGDAKASSVSAVISAAQVSFTLVPVRFIPASFSVSGRVPPNEHSRPGGWPSTTKAADLCSPPACQGGAE